MNAEQIIIEAISLPLEQRARVVGSILQTLPPTSAGNDEAWLIPARRRLAELRSGEVAAVRGEAVFERILSRYGV